MMMFGTVVRHAVQALQLPGGPWSLPAAQPDASPVVDGNDVDAFEPERFQKVLADGVFICTFLHICVQKLG